RLTGIGQAEQHPLFDLLELATFDLVVATAFIEIERKELLLAAKFFGEKLVDESDVIIELAHFENLFAPEAEALVPRAPRSHVLAVIPLFAEATFVPPLFNVAIELDAEFVRVEAAA